MEIKIKTEILISITEEDINQFVVENLAKKGIIVTSTPSYGKEPFLYKGVKEGEEDDSFLSLPLSAIFIQIKERVGSRVSNSLRVLVHEKKLQTLQELLNLEASVFFEIRNNGNKTYSKLSEALISIGAPKSSIFLQNK